MNQTATLSLKRISKCNLNFDAKLSARESEISEQVILGHTQIETAEIFFLSPFTVSQTIRNAFTKTGARNISELGVWYYCKKFGAAIDFSHPMRRIVPMVFLFLILNLEFAGKTDLRSRIRCKRAKDEYECLIESFDFTEPIVPIL